MPGPTTANAARYLISTLHGSCTVNIETSYGLRVRVDPQGALTACLMDDAKARPLPAPDDNGEPMPTFKYRIFPDWGTEYIWYDTTWPENPKDDYQLQEDELEERYQKPFVDSYRTWWKTFELAFEKAECNSGSDNEVFPDPEDDHAWTLEGLLLACFIALDADCESVEYSCDTEEILVEGGTVGAVLTKFFQDTWP